MQAELSSGNLTPTRQKKETESSGLLTSIASICG